VWRGTRPLCPGWGNEAGAAEKIAPHRSKENPAALGCDEEPPQVWTIGEGEEKPSN